eukprot:gene12226-8413_t
MFRGIHRWRIAVCCCGSSRQASYYAYRLQETGYGSSSRSSEPEEGQPPLPHSPIGVSSSCVSGETKALHRPFTGLGPFTNNSRVSWQQGGCPIPSGDIFRYSSMVLSPRSSASSSKAATAGAGAAAVKSSRGTAQALRKTSHTSREDGALMDDKEVAAAASKLLTLLAPSARGKRGHGALAAVSSASYLAPPEADAEAVQLLEDVEAEAKKRAAFGSAQEEEEGRRRSTLQQLPSRRTHILSKAEQREFDEAVAAAEALLAEEQAAAEQLAASVVSKKRQRGNPNSNSNNNNNNNNGAAAAAVAESEEEPLTDPRQQQQQQQQVALRVTENTPTSLSLTPTLSCLPSTVANPFKGLHDHLRRSYRLDEVLAEADRDAVVLAKQEPKTGVFSYLTLEAGLDTYKKHWMVKYALREHHDNAFLRRDEDEEAGGCPDEEAAPSEARGRRGGKRKSASKQAGKAYRSEALEAITSSGDLIVPEALDGGNSRTMGSAAADYVLADPVHAWGGLGWEYSLIDVDYSLLLAQRLLLFPSSQRHFHALCGRQDVPCDFFADLDLPDVSQEEAEKILVEVLDYLEIRLPGVGFTDPFFLVLTNEAPEDMIIATNSSGEQGPSQSRNTPPSAARHEKRTKVSYHLHARSMTYVHDREQRPMEELMKALKKQRQRRAAAGKGKKRSDLAKGGRKRKGAAAEANSEETAAESAEDDVEGGEGAATAEPVTVKVAAPRGATKVIAFQDYRSVKLIADEINQTLGFTVVDEACYRTHGSLRCAFSRKTPPNATSAVLAASAASCGSALVMNSSSSSSSSQMSGGVNSLSTSSSGSPSGAVRHNIQPALVPLQIQKDMNVELKKKLQEMHEVVNTLSAPEILSLTFCTRHLHHGGIPTLTALQEYLSVGTMTTSSHTGTLVAPPSSAVFRAATVHAFKLVRPAAILGPQAAAQWMDGQANARQVLGPDGLPLPRPQASTHMEYDAYGNAVSPYLTEAAKWRRYKSVIGKLQHVPPRAATSFDIWVRIGLALHNFSNEEHVFEEWVKFSLKCPEKYSRDACRKKWLQFERNPDALNWRRGFNYLNQTLWRQI